MVLGKELIVGVHRLDAVGVVPPEVPTPRGSARITRWSAPRPSTTAGSQSSSGKVYALSTR